MDTSDEVAVLDRERRWGRLAGLAAIFSIAATVAAVVIASQASEGSALPSGPPGLSDARIDRAERLVSFDRHEAALATSTGLRCLGLLLMVVVGVYVYSLVRTRDERAVKPFVLYLTFVAPALIVASTVLGFLAYSDVADAFIASPPPAGTDAIAAAAKLIDDSTGLAIANVGDGVSRVVVALWLALLATAAMRVGLLTRFLGYWGVAGGASLVLLPVGDAMVAAWIGSVGILALGYWPGGRPLAWDSTEPQEIEAI